MTDELDARMEDLIEELSSMNKVAVAFSGGVDSSLLLSLAGEACESTVGLMGVSEIISGSELKMAREIADEIGASIVEVPIPIMEEATFLLNNESRCYACKRLLYQALFKTARELGYSILLDGTNSDDLKEDRAGSRAVAELDVTTPLADLGINKGEVREMARRRGLGFSERPENTCLATRIPMGESIEFSRLRRIEEAEDELHSRGIEDLRVRDHDGLARIEVRSQDANILIENAESISDRLREFGFSYVTLDLGSLEE
jgi:uncharacterized protein